VAFNGLSALPALNIDTGYLNGTTGIDAYRLGAADRVQSDQRDLMKDVGQTAATGNFLAAAQTAMRGGDVKTGIDISNWDMGRRTKAIDFLNEGAKRADSPAKWNALVDVAERAFGTDMVGKYRDFNSRPAALTALEAATLKIQQANAEREAQETAARIPYLNAQTKAAGQKDVLNEVIADRIRRSLPAPDASTVPAPVQTPPTVQPQSFEGSAPQSGLVLTGNDQSQPQMLPRFAPVDLARASGPQGGNLILAGNSPPAAAAAPPIAPAQQPDMIDTPLFGRMRTDDARNLGMALSLAGKGDAGKLLTDSANQGTSLTKPTTAQLEEKSVNSAVQLARLADIEKRYDPKFLEIPNRMKMLGASWSAKTGAKLSPEMTQELSRYAAFRSSSVNNLNTILKEVSGAAVTPQEYERIQNDQPVAGTGIFDGDDPVSFKAKMDRSNATVRAALARYNFMRSKGLNFDRDSLDQFMSLDDVPAAIDRRGAQIEQELKQKNPKADPMMLQKQTEQQLKREFGI
jgi:hypothetical protein